MLQDNFREDGRSCEDFRHMELETGLISNTNGSARVRLVCFQINIQQSNQHENIVLITKYIVLFLWKNIRVEFLSLLHDYVFFFYSLST